MSVPAAHFEALYRADPDPWGFADDPYERAKYARTVAALGGARARRALELGCSIGVLTAALAAHCDALVACDAAPTAVATARERLTGTPGVEILQAVLPGELPAGPFDLVVASEVLYYLDGPALARTLDGLEAALAPGGVLLAVHWTGHAPSHPLHADEVHAVLRARPALRLDLEERHDGYRLDRLVRA